VALQAVVQLPQCSWLLASDTHSDPHSMKPLAQAQMPALHDWPDPQLLVQLPQCWTLLFRSKHP
jgi:hypothetical protein